MSKTVKIWCNEGGHFWDRPSQRGRRPYNCPEHTKTETPVSPKNVVVTSVKVEKKGGIDFDRLLERREELNAAYSEAYEWAIALDEESEADKSITPADISEAWSKVDKIQNAFIVTERRINALTK